MNFRNNFFQNNNAPNQQDSMSFGDPRGNINQNNNFNNPVYGYNNNPASSFEQQTPAYPSRFNNAPVQPYGYDNPNQSPAYGNNSGYSVDNRRGNRLQYNNRRMPNVEQQQYQQYDGNQNYGPYPHAVDEYTGQQQGGYYGDDQQQYGNRPAARPTREQYNRFTRTIAGERRRLAYGTPAGMYDENTYNYDDYYDEAPVVREEDSKRNHKSRFFTKLATRRKKEEAYDDERSDRAYSRREDERRDRRRARSRNDKYEDDYDDYEDEDEDDDYEDERRPSRSKKSKKRSKSRYEDDEDDYEDEDEDENEEPKNRKKGFFSGPVDFFKKKKRG